MSATSVIIEMWTNKVLFFSLPVAWHVPLCILGTYTLLQYILFFIHLYICIFVILNLHVNKLILRNKRTGL